MSTSEPTAPRGNSLQNAIDIIIAPTAAFERIRAVPSWGWAFLVASLLGVAGFLLAHQAYIHAFDVSGPSLYGPAVAKMPPDQQSAALARMLGFGRMMINFQFVFIPLGVLIGALISAVIMLIANAVSRGDGTFKRFFALAMATAVVSSLGLLLNGLIALVRGPSSYETMQSVQTGVPSLALLAPGASAKLATFLGVLNVTALWAAALGALGMVAVGNVKPAVAWTATIVVLLLGAALASLAVQ